MGTRLPLTIPTRHRSATSTHLAAATCGVTRPALTFSLARRLPCHRCFALATALALAANRVSHIVSVAARATPLAAARSSAAGLATANATAVTIIACAIGFFFFADITAVDVPACGNANYHALNHDDAPPR